MTQVYTIRPAVPEDEAFLIALTPRLAAFSLPAWRTAGEIARSDHEILRDALHGRREGAAILVAELAHGSGTGDPRAGYVFATTKHDYFTREPHAHVEVLVVDSAAERRGVARALMAAIEAWARGCGMGAVTLNVFDRNLAAQALYARLGYEREIVHYRKALG